jgi:creatinine amidohydrolase
VAVREYWKRPVLARDAGTERMVEGGNRFVAFPVSGAQEKLLGAPEWPPGSAALGLDLAAIPAKRRRSSCLGREPAARDGHAVPLYNQRLPEGTMPERVLLEELTWPEIKQALDDDWRTVVIPTASVEQHGPHLPLLTDTLIGGRVAELIARKLGKTFVAPVIRPGLSSHHMAFAGSLTTTPETFRAVIEDNCRSLASHGFRTFILTSGHGGNFTFLDAIGPYLQDSLRKQGYNVRIVAYANGMRYARIQQDFVGEKFGVPLEEAAFHADVIGKASSRLIITDHYRLYRSEPGWIGDNASIIDRMCRGGLQAVSP